MNKEFREKAIARYLAALTSNALTDEVKANINVKLAMAYTNRTEGIPAENLDLAIEYFKKAFNYEVLPEERARIHHNLSIALRKRTHGDRSENIEQSINHCQQALEYRNEDTTPLEWSDTQRSLGESYVFRLNGEKSDNVEYAINCYNRALTAATFQTDPIRWASTHMSLAAAYMAHPNRTRERVLQSAIHCRDAQRVFTHEDDPNRWELCEKIIESQLSADPAFRTAESLAARLKERTAEDDPFGGIPDQLLNYIQDPKNMPKGETPEAVTEELIEIFADKIRKTVADKLGNPKLAENGFLDIHVVVDWDINAQVETQPPYNIYISTNLVRFCSMMSELLMFGLGISMTDDGGGNATPNVVSAISTDEISRYLRQVLDAFLLKQEIPRIPTNPGPGHYVMSLVNFISTMTFLVSHEIGHVIFNDYKSLGETPPFYEFADAILETVFNDLIEGRHHPFDPRGLEGRDEMDLSEVYSRWVEEIASDIIGASLTMEYQNEEGPWAKVPDIVAQTRFGVHIALVSQMIISLYCNLISGEFLLMSPAHPPMDFRTFCVLKWMYRDDHEEAEGPVAHYVQTILEKLLAEAATESL